MAFLFSGMIQAQEKTTLNIKDLNSDIQKYVKKNYEGFKITEAFKYDVIYEMKIQKGSSSEDLVFDKEGKFLYKKAEAEQGAVTLQTRSTMSLKDVESDITKYIKKNFEDYQVKEAFIYDEVYTTRIVKGAENETLVFDKDGKFIMKGPAPESAKEPVKTDTVSSKPVKTGEPAKADTIKK